MTCRDSGTRSAAILAVLFCAALGPVALAPAALAQSPDADPVPGGLTPLEVNRDQLVEMAVRGAITDPTLRDPPYRVAPDGTVRSLPGTGSITYNFRVGDSAVELAGDHVVPQKLVVKIE
jgi:hypothetical protein